MERTLSLGKWLLAALLLSCIFLPRIPIGSIAHFYSLDLRGEDLFLIPVAFLVLGRVVGKVSVPGIPWVERAFLCFILAAEISLLNGLWMRTIDKPFLSLFYLLKWMEYLLIFVVTVRLTVSQKEARFFLKTFFLLGIAVACYGYGEHFFPASRAVYPNYYRLFERFPFHGDANHIGGFLVVWIGFFTGIFLKSERLPRSVFLLTFLLFVFFPFVWTYSRKSYFALGGAFAFGLLFLENKRKLLGITCLFLILGLLLPTRLSERLLDLGEAFTSTDPFHSSWAGNWMMWKESLWNFQQFFLFGSGLGSRHRLFYESQYILVLAETGIFGSTFFLLLCLALLREVGGFLHHSLSNDEKGMVLGWLLGFVGLLIHNLSCVSFTVTKIAIPFWFLTASVFTPLKQDSALPSNRVFG